MGKGDIVFYFLFITKVVCADCKDQGERFFTRASPTQQSRRISFAFSPIRKNTLVRFSFCFLFCFVFSQACFQLLIVRLTQGHYHILFTGIENGRVSTGMGSTCQNSQRYGPWLAKQHARKENKPKIIFSSNKSIMSLFLFPCQK